MKGKVKGAAAALQWFAQAEQMLEVHAPQINRLNVFPVPDSDTGSNMLATIRACRQAVEEAAGARQSDAEEDLGRLLSLAGSRAMGEACGNSGTLLAVLISGFAEPLHGSSRLTVEGLSRALDRASLRAWSALSAPVDGTMLSVLDAVRDAAHNETAAAQEPDSRAALEAAMPRLVAAAREALVRTEQQLPVLTRAQVVDSGGLGLLLVLAALAATVRGESPMQYVQDDLLTGLSGWAAAGEESRAGASGAPSSIESSTAEASLSGVEIMSTVRLDPLGAASLRHRLDELGEAVIITPIGGEAEVDGSLRWRIHVHAQDEQAVLEAISAAGAVESSAVTPLGS